MHYYGPGSYLGQAAIMELLAPISSRVQADLGKFLQARQWLEAAARGARTPDEAEQVAALLASQGRLEAEAGPALSAVQAGDYSLDTVTNATLFLGQMELHLAAVADQQKRMAHIRGAQLVTFDWPTIAMWGGVVAGLMGFVARSPALVIAGGLGAALGFYNRTPSA